MNRTFTKKRMGLVAVCMLSLISCSKDDSTEPAKPTQQIHYTLASKVEGEVELMSNEHYFNSLGQADIDWRMRKTGATLDELKTFTKAQVMDFTDEQKTVVKRGIDAIEARLAAMHVQLPFPKDITYVCTSMNEEGGSQAYTHKTAVYLGPHFFTYHANLDDPATFNHFLYVMAHELFHCLTRNDADFRKTMYNLIGFTVMEQDLQLKGENKSMMLSNPDVEHIDNYAEFTINGQKRKCELMVLYSKTWAEASAGVEDPSSVSFFRNFRQVLVPIDATDTNYDIDQVPDFWDRVGRNTTYVFAPEECMADNFGFAIAYGLNGKDYQTPELIRNIITTLQQKYPSKI